MWRTLVPHIKPLQQPHPPIGVSGLSPRSETLMMAGERGFLPMSPEQNIPILASQWGAIEEGARRSGRTARRSDWRIVRDVFVADTDEEAMRLSVGGAMGRMWNDYYLALLTDGDYLKYMKHEEDVPDDEVTVEYCATHQWLVGSPDTVAEKLDRMYEAIGGFGTLLVMCYDYTEDPEPYHRSLQLFAQEVMPRFADRVPT
jgi:alkanesulfonate monooxygenase SsuD/methylene tetrahydromethanopterin reductase-like flavin-dependent oxidoreductase (luciferase family)